MSQDGSYLESKLIYNSSNVIDSAIQLQTNSQPNKNLNLQFSIIFKGTVERNLNVDPKDNQSTDFPLRSTPEEQR